LSIPCAVLDAGVISLRKAHPKEASRYVEFTKDLG
jgi:uncharacterized DUF497 family protein